ncbi:hypothetical protein F8388_008159, partial [Cannabis sativa]
AKSVVKDFIAMVMDSVVLVLLILNVFRKSVQNVMQEMIVFPVATQTFAIMKVSGMWYCDDGDDLKAKGVVKDFIVQVLDSVFRALLLGTVMMEMTFLIKFGVLLLGIMMPAILNTFGALCI